MKDYVRRFFNLGLKFPVTTDITDGVGIAAQVARIKFAMLDQFETRVIPSLLPGVHRIGNGVALRGNGEGFLFNECGAGKQQRENQEQCADSLFHG